MHLKFVVPSIVSMNEEDISMASRFRLVQLVPVLMVSEYLSSISVLIMKWNAISILDLKSFKLPVYFKTLYQFSFNFHSNSGLWIEIKMLELKSIMCSKLLPIRRSITFTFTKNAFFWRWHLMISYFLG